MASLEHSIELTKSLTGCDNNIELEVDMYLRMRKVLSPTSQYPSVTALVGASYEIMFQAVGRALRQCKNKKCPGYDRPIRVYEGRKYSFLDFMEREPDDAILFIHEAHQMIGINNAELLNLFQSVFDIKFPRNNIALLCGEPWLRLFDSDDEAERFVNSEHMDFEFSKRLQDQLQREGIRVPQ